MLKNVTMATVLWLGSFGLAQANLECAIGEYSPEERSAKGETAEKTATIDSIADADRIKVTMIGIV